MTARERWVAGFGQASDYGDAPSNVTRALALSELADMIGDKAATLLDKAPETADALIEAACAVRMLADAPVSLSGRVS